MTCIGIINSGQAVKTLMEAALILDIRSLRECCASYFATIIYFKKHDMQAFEAVRNKLGIKTEFTQEISNSLKKKYPLMLHQ